MKKLLFLFFALLPTLLFAQKEIVWKQQNVRLPNHVDNMEVTKCNDKELVAKSKDAVLTISLLDKFTSATDKAFYNDISGRLVDLTNTESCPVVQPCPEIFYTFLKEKGFEKVEGNSSEINLSNLFYGYMTSVKAKDADWEQYCLVVKNCKTDRFLLINMNYNKSKAEQTGLMLLNISNFE